MPHIPSNLSPAGDHSDAIPTGTSFQAPTRPPARELHGAGPTSDPALHPLPASTRAPTVAGHPFPRPHSRPHSEQQKKRPQRAATNSLANFSHADIIRVGTSLYDGSFDMQRLFVLCLSLALVFSLSACTPTQEDAPEDTSTPEVTEPADTSTPEQTAPAEPDDQEPQETAETTADTEPTETPSAETPVPAPVQQSTQEQEPETSTPVIPSDGGGNPDSGAGSDAGQTSGNQGGSGNTGGNSSSVNPGTSGGQVTPPSSEEAVGGSSNPGGLTEEEQANVDDKKDRIENAGGSFDPNGWGFWVP